MRGALSDGTTISGTIDYLSPEQVRGEPLDAATDLFSLGVVLYEMITSRPPFEGTNATTVLAALLNEEPRPLGAFRDDIPLELENIVRKALAKNRADRYHSAVEMTSDLKKILSQLAAGPIRAGENQNGNDGEAVGADTRGATVGLKERLGNRRPLWLNSYRRWFLTAAVLAAVGLGLDVLLLHSQGIGWGRDSLFLLVSAVGFLLYKVPRLQVSKRVLSLPQGAAFRGLLPFQEADRDRFYGRDIDIAAVLEKVIHRDFRFGVLYGDSGCGKTSLIQAGILPRLREEGYVAVYCRSYKDPVDALVENSQRQNLMEVRPGESPSDYLRRLSQTLTAEIVIVFDQFEEFFTNFKSRADREPLVSGKSVAYSPDGRWVATGSEGIILWDVATQTKFLRLEQPATVTSLAYSPDGRWLVSAHADGSIVVWDAIEHAKLANLKEHSGPVHSVAFSRDGARLSSGSEDRSIVIWNTRLGMKEAVLLGHETRITAVAFSPDGKLGSSDLAGTSILWDLETKQLLSKFMLHQNSNALAFSPDGRWMVTPHGVFDTAERRQVIDFAANIRGFFYGLAFSPDGRLLAGAATDVGQLSIFATDRWELIERVGTPETLERPRAVNFSPDGRWIVTGDIEGGVALWKAKPLQKVGLLGCHTAETTAVAFSPDGRRVVSASDDQTIALWDVQRRRLISYIGSHTAPVKSVAFSPDGMRLASGEGDGSVRIYTRHRTLWGHQLD